MSIAESFRRANSHLRYWRYRRQIGNPVPFWGTVRDWFDCFVFELRNGAKP